MADASFLKMIYADLLSDRLAFLKAAEENNRLLYIEKPNLERLYKTLIGNYEQSVMEKELEAELMQRKVELIQAKINRREPIDMEAIEAMLAEERQSRLDEINGMGGSDKQLTSEADETDSAEDTAKLQSLYSEIMKNFHPELNPNATATQKELFDKALEAYKNRDLDALQLIYDMLFEVVEGSGMEIEIPISFSVAGADKEIEEIVEYYSTDYELARMLYPFFTPMKEDEILRIKSESMHAKLAECLEANEMLQKSFPYDAREVILDEKKREEYLAALRYREMNAEHDITDCQKRIKEMVGEQHG